MAAPQIRRVRGATPWVGRERVLFEVVGAGEFGGREWREGELAVCAPSASEGDVVVLAPEGMGRARLGAVVGARLHGDRGEPCSRARWSIVGRVEAVIRPARVGERAVPHVTETLRPLTVGVTMGAIGVKGAVTGRRWAA